jgi:hypothetical protein
MTITDQIGMNQEDVASLCSADAPTYTTYQEFSSQLPLFRFVENKWKGSGIDADWSDNTFTDIAFWGHDDNADVVMMFEFLSDTDQHWVGDLTLDRTVFSDIDCYDCEADNTLFRAYNGNYEMTDIEITNINANVYAGGYTTANRMFEFKLRKPYTDGGTITEHLYIDEIQVNSYQSEGRLFTVDYDSTKTQDAVTATNIYIKSTSGTQNTFADITVGTDSGAVMYANALEMELEFDNILFSNIEGADEGGVFHVIDAKSYTFTDIDASNFKANDEGSFLYHQATSITEDQTLSVSDSTFDCDNVSTFDWTTIKSEVDV